MNEAEKYLKNKGWYSGSLVMTKVNEHGFVTIPEAMQQFAESYHKAEREKELAEFDDKRLNEMLGGKEWVYDSCCFGTTISGKHEGAKTIIEHLKNKP